jgi:hypothetical protein
MMHMLIPYWKVAVLPSELALHPARPRPKIELHTGDSSRVAALGSHLKLKNAGMKGTMTA